MSETLTSGRWRQTMTAINRAGLPTAYANRASAPDANGPNAALVDTRDQRVLNAARMYEQQFLGEMVKAMRGSVSESELVPSSMGEKIFREQLDDKYVEEWSHTGGVGFADLIYNHIMERYMHRGPDLQRPKGPLPLQGTGAVDVKIQDRVNSDSQKTEVHIKHPSTSSATTPQNLTSPWDGKAILLEGRGLKAYIIDHGNGLRSTLSFEGTPTVASGQEVKAGAKLALLDPHWQDIYWNIS